MKNTFIVGSQWGDEGKGKIIDVLAKDADVVARAQGGPNAGHTVVVEGDAFVLHLIPSGILRREALCVIGNGVVIAVERLLDEMDKLTARGVTIGENLLISDRAHLILPYHVWEERLHEEDEKGRLGTTLRGVGPAYSAKATRVTGIRVCDLLDFDVFREKFLRNLSRYASIAASSGEFLDVERTLAQYETYAERIRPHVCDTSLVLNRAWKDGKSILYEGAQGSLLDVDFGTYPYVTSSNTTVGGICTGLGLPPFAIEEVVGVVKAYTTRVGMGPFPTEMDAELGEAVRRKGNEYGATTGRPRRCGWLDAVGLRYASRINGFTQLAITKLDVLDYVKTLKIGVGYRYRGEVLDEFPAQLKVLEECEPVYEELPGWEADTVSALTYAELPGNTRRYLDRIEAILEVPITVVSVGRKRSETILGK